MLGEFGRRGLQDLAQHARLEFHQRAVDLGAGPLPVRERCRIVAELDADLGEDAVGGLLDADEIFLRQDVVGRDVADDVGPAEPLGPVRALLAARAAAAALAAPAGLEPVSIAAVPIAVPRFSHKIAAADAAL